MEAVYPQGAARPGEPRSPPPANRVALPRTLPSRLDRQRSGVFPEHLLCARPQDRLQSATLASSLSFPQLCCSPRGGPLSLPSLGADALRSAYYAPDKPGLYALALFFSALTLPLASPISGCSCLPLSPLAQLTGSSRRGQGPLGLQSPPSAHTRACLQGGGDFLFMRITRTPGAVPRTGLLAALAV